LLPDRLDAAGIHGSDRARLLRDGTLTRDGRTFHLNDLSIPRRGQSVAVVMDTRWCDGALELANDVDLLLVEATFLAAERDLGLQQVLEADDEPVELRDPPTRQQHPRHERRPIERVVPQVSVCPSPPKMTS
jgi:hypothetical protein